MDAARAFAGGKPYKKDNTRVHQIGATSFMVLHNSTIAIKCSDGSLWLSFCGFYTSTTTRRLQAVLDVSGKGGQFCRRRGVMYLRAFGGEFQFIGIINPKYPRKNRVDRYFNP
jgi:hypothetical protein